MLWLAHGTDSSPPGSCPKRPIWPENALPGESSNLCRMQPDPPGLLAFSFSGLGSAQKKVNERRRMTQPIGPCVGKPIVLALRGGVHKTRIPTPTMAAVDSVDDEDIEQEGEEVEEEFKSDPDLDAPELDATEDDLVSEASLRPDLSACIKRCTHMTSSKLRRTSQMPQPVPVRCCVPRPPKSPSSQSFNLHAKVLIHACILASCIVHLPSFFHFSSSLKTLN